jgi:hypothetical protein
VSRFVSAWFCVQVGLLVAGCKTRLYGEVTASPDLQPGPDLQAPADLEQTFDLGGGDQAAPVADLRMPSDLRMPADLAASCVAPAGGGAKAISFAPGLDLPIATGAFGAFSFRDLNGDCKTDLLASFDSTPTQVMVFLNQGNRTWAAPVAYDLGAVINVRSLPLGDVNGDGTPDLVVAGADRISVLLDQADGTLVQSGVYSLDFQRGFPGAESLGDLNGDGNLDLAVTGTSDTTVFVMLGDGQGGFGPAASYPADAEGALALGDLNGDGWLDLAALSDVSVDVWINRGNGSFGTRTSYAALIDPGSLALGDLDGDGDPDLAFVEAFGTSEVSVLLNRGDGTFLQRIDYPIAAREGYAPLVALGDLDGDGALDLVVAYDDVDALSIEVLRNDGSGNLLSGPIYPGVVKINVPEGPTALALGDLDGDGLPEIAVASDRTATILFNTSR